MMFRLVRFLIIALTLGRIKWLMRLTWVWRFIVFLGLTGWLSKKLRQMVGLDKKQSSEVDSAWAEALRYEPTPAKESPVAPKAAGPVSESRSEVTGTSADETSETITFHEVTADGETETIARIADDAGNVETIVSGVPVEEIDLANLGTPATEPAIEEIVEAEIESAAAIEDILDTLESAEPEMESVETETVEVVPDQPRKKRKPAVKKPVETTDVEPGPVALIDPDWVRGDGSLDCPLSHPVKAKVNSMIYYIPESGHYDRAVPDVCFASDLDAEAAGYRAPRR